MGNVFVVKIGTYTRKGMFVESVVRYIESDANSREIQNFMESQYVGMSVVVSSAHKIEALHVPKADDDEENQKPSSGVVKTWTSQFLLNVKLAFDKESDLYKLYQEAHKAREVFNQADMILQGAVRNYFYKKPFIMDVHFDVDIEYGYVRAHIRQLPLKYKKYEEEIIGSLEENEGQKE